MSTGGAQGVGQGGGRGGGGGARGGRGWYSQPPRQGTATAPNATPSTATNTTTTTAGSSSGSGSQSNGGVSSAIGHIHTLRKAMLREKAKSKHTSLCRVALEFARGRGFPEPVVNPVALTGEGGVRFLNGLEALGYASLDDLLNKPTHYMVGFHGTRSVAAIPSIFRDNFDPCRRTRQQFGPGEYFDIDQGGIAEQFARDLQCVVVALIVLKDKQGNELPEVKTEQYHNTGQKILVVANPADKSYALNIPCAVVSKQEVKAEVSQRLVNEFAEEFRAIDLEDVAAGASGGRQDGSSHAATPTSSSVAAAGQQQQFQRSPFQQPASASAPQQQQQNTFCQQQRLPARGPPPTALKGFFKPGEIIKWYWKVDLNKPHDDDSAWKAYSDRDSAELTRSHSLLTKAPVLVSDGYAVVPDEAGCYQIHTWDRNRQRPVKVERIVNPLGFARVSQGGSFSFGVSTASTSPPKTFSNSTTTAPPPPPPGWLSRSTQPTTEKGAINGHRCTSSAGGFNFDRNHTDARNSTQSNNISNGSKSSDTSAAPAFTFGGTEASSSPESSSKTTFAFEAPKSNGFADFTKNHPPIRFGVSSSGATASTNFSTTAKAQGSAPAFPSPATPAPQTQSAFADNQTGSPSNNTAAASRGSSNAGQLFSGSFGSGGSSNANTLPSGGPRFNFGGSSSTSTTSGGAPAPRAVPFSFGGGSVAAAPTNPAPSSVSQSGGAFSFGANTVSSTTTTAGGANRAPTGVSSPDHSNHSNNGQHPPAAEQPRDENPTTTTNAGGWHQFDTKK